LKRISPPAAAKAASLAGSFTLVLSSFGIRLSIIPLPSGGDIISSMLCISTFPWINLPCLATLFLISRPSPPRGESSPGVGAADMGHLPGDAWAERGRSRTAYRLQIFSTHEGAGNVALARAPPVASTTSDWPQWAYTRRRPTPNTERPYMFQHGPRYPKGSSLPVGSAYRCPRTPRRSRKNTRTVTSLSFPSSSP